MRTGADIAISSTMEIVDEIRNGRMFILVDNHSRDNNGCLVLPAQMSTPNSINFMATHGRGLICLALAKERVEQLMLELLPNNHRSKHENAFTVSIEAVDGVSTGISAADRARTIATAIDATKGAEAIVSPGHVFPLVAQPGGVLVRAGYAEAAVDLARLAGLNPSGVICEIIRTDGEMAQLQDLMELAHEHGLKIGTISDLIAYRLRHDGAVERVAEVPFHSDYGGDWRLLTYRNKIDDSLHYVLRKGEIRDEPPTLVRVHNVYMFSDMLGEAGPRKRLLQRSMNAIAEAGGGVIVLIIPARVAHEPDGSDHDARFGMDLRNYGVGAQILADLGVTSMRLLTTAERKIIGLEGFGISIAGQTILEG